MMKKYHKPIKNAPFWAQNFSGQKTPPKINPAPIAHKTILGMRTWPAKNTIKATIINITPMVNMIIFLHLGKQQTIYHDFPFTW